MSQPPGSLKTTTWPRLIAAELLDHDPVVDLQGVLHRDRRDQEHLPDEAAQQRGDDDRADDDSRSSLKKASTCWPKVSCSGVRVGRIGLVSSGSAAGGSARRGIALLRRCAMSDYAAISWRRAFP